MSKTLPNSYCKKCKSFSRRLSNEACSKMLANGRYCDGVLFGILEGELGACPVCSGTGKSQEGICDVCDGYSYEYTGL
jgi:DnaJ-class molecular chaperone